MRHIMVVFNEILRIADWLPLVDVLRNTFAGPFKEIMIPPLFGMRFCLPSTCLLFIDMARELDTADVALSHNRRAARD